MHDVLLSIVPVITGAFVTGVGWLVRNSRNEMLDRMDKLDTGFARIGADIVRDIHTVERRLDAMDRRVTRLESWKELESLPDLYARRRRHDDMHNESEE